MLDPNRSLKVFLCHASADKPAVRELYKRLENDGVDAWLDSEDLIPGQNWRVEIPKAVENSDIVLVCLSERSVNKEGYVQKEIVFALDKALEMPEGRIFLIPVRLEDCEVPRRLSDYQWVDLFSENGYERLMLALKLRAEQIGVESPARKGWLPKISSKPAISKPKQGEPSVSRDQESPQKISTVLASESKDARDKLVEPPKTNYIVAILGIAAIVVAAIIVTPFVSEWFSPAPESTVTETTQALSLPTEVIVAVTSTNVIYPTVALTNTFPPTTSPTNTITPTAPLLSEITDGSGVEMVLVLEGQFAMGSDVRNDEKPVHQVYLDSYYIDKYEVTNALYKICVDVGVCGQPIDSTYYQNPQYLQHPVVYVNWNMANEYCEWRDARLPTEAEWEKAARNTDERTFPWGNVIDMTYANYFGNDIMETTAVGSYPKGVSPYGAYDMAGNAKEWTADWYDDTYYANSPPTNPGGPITGQYRVVRGGSWGNFGISIAADIRSFFRSRIEPIESNNSIGFRCARSP